MKTIINYIREFFCNHDWLIEEKPDCVEYNYHGKLIKKGIRVYMRCKICGKHNSHWKF